MFDGIHRPEGYEEKPKSATWAKPVTEVHTSKNTNASSEPIHPVRPVEKKKSTLPILLLVLFLAVLGGGAYYWYANYYVVEDPVVIADNSMMQPEDNKVMEKEDVMEEEENVELVFPDDYFLSEEEMPVNIEGTYMPPKKESNSIELHDLYENASLAGAEESWVAQYNLEEDSRIVIMVTLFSTEEILDIEERKISQTDHLEFLGKRDMLAFLRKDNTLLVIASYSKDDVLFQEVLNIYEKKLDTKAVSVLQGHGLGVSMELKIETTVHELLNKGIIFSDDNQGSYSGFCDEPSVLQTREELKALTIMDCLDSAESFALSVKLDNSYWCMDSDGIQKDTLTSINSTSCDNLEEYTSEEDLAKEEEIIDPEHLQDREILLCYVIYDSSAISYYPNIDLRNEHQDLIVDLQNNYTEGDIQQFFYNECEVELIDGPVFAEIKRTIYLDEDQDGLTLYFENIYGSSDENSDTDGDSYDDKTEVENGYSPVDNIASIGDKEVDIVIHVNGQTLTSNDLIFVSTKFYKQVQAPQIIVNIEDSEPYRIMTLQQDCESNIITEDIKQSINEADHSYCWQATVPYDSNFVEESYLVSGHGRLLAEYQFVDDSGIEYYASTSLDSIDFVFETK